MSTQYMWSCERCNHLIRWTDLKHDTDGMGRSRGWHLSWTPGPRGEVFVCGPVYEFAVERQA